MNISKHNYEAFLLDYLEGRLSQRETAVLKAFVLRHPELGSWVELTGELPFLKAEQLSFPDKNQLLQQPQQLQSDVNTENAEHYFIAWHEGLLSEQEKEQLTAFLTNNPELVTDFELYGASYLKPDLSLMMPGKHELQRNAPLIPLFIWRGMSVAASLLLLLSLGWWWLRPGPAVIPVVTDNQQPTVSAIAEPKTPEIPIENTPVETVVPNNQAKLQTYTSPSFNIRNADVIALPTMAMRNPDAVKRSENNPNVKAPETTANDRLLLARLIENNSPSLAGRPAALRVLDNTLNKAMEITGLNILRNDSRSDLTSETSLSSLATAGVKAYNTLTDKEVDLKKTEDEKGRQQLKLRSERVLINRYTGGN